LGKSEAAIVAVSRPIEKAFIPGREVMFGIMSEDKVVCRRLSVGLGLVLLSGCAAPAYRELDIGSLTARPKATSLGPLKGPLTLPVAIERALAVHGEIAVLKSALNVAIQRKGAAGDLTDPELRLSYNDGNRETHVSVPDNVLSDTMETTRGFSIGVRLTPPQPWARSARISAETANLNAAAMDLKAAQWRVSVEVCRLFIEIRYLESDRAVLNQLVVLFEENITLFKQRAEEKQAVVAVSERYLQSLSSRDRALRELAESRRRLAALIGVSADQLALANPADTKKTPDLKTLSLSQLQQETIARRADVWALRWRCSAAKEAYREARAARIPWFNFVQFSCATGEQSAENGDSLGPAPIGGGSGYDRTDTLTWRIDTGISIPLFGWKNNTPELRRAEYEQVKTQLAETVKTIYQTVKDSLNAVHSLGELQSKYEAESEPVIRDMKTVLNSLNKETGMSPDEIQKLREQILKLQRLKLEQDHEFRLAVVNLGEALGVWLVPPASR